MMNSELCGQSLDCFINEVGTPVTHEDLRTPKSGQDLFKNKLRNGIRSTILYWLCFGPPGYVISGNNNVAHTRLLPWWVDKSYEIDGPLIKCL